MANYSSVRSRRFAAKKKEATQQIIIFRLRQEWFALPINSVQKVVPLGKVHGDPQGTGISLTNYQGKEILVIDVSHRIFGEPPSLDLAISGAKDTHSQQRFLLMVQNKAGELVGLPIDSQPALRRVPKSSFTPLPSAYVAEGNIQCLSSTMIQLENRPSLFLLDPEQLAEIMNPL